MKKTVYDINNYREACKYLQDKYGAPEHDYYHINKKGNLAGYVISRGKEGLQCHHICEDIVPGLSSQDQAEKYWEEHPEYQAKENLCYCNLLEHAWLHILITECSEECSDEEEGNELGVGGVKWMLLALNSIMCNKDVSWYSSKRISDGRGCSYNINDIITGHKKEYLKVINRFCTSAFIRSKLGMNPQELAQSICLSCKSDGEADGGLLDIYETILKEASTSLLKEHNVNAFCDLENYLRKDRTALVYICTGGGKTTTALEYIRIHNAKALILGPNNTIGDGWKKNQEYMNYQTFMNCYADINWKKYDVIICDEVHHTDAPRWGKGLEYALQHSNVKIIGLTATPTDKQFNASDKYFGGRICNGLDIAEGLKVDPETGKSVIHPFSYVQSYYKIADMKGEFDKYGSIGNLMFERLNIKLNENPVQEILKKHMPDGQRKIIVFCSAKKDMDYAEDVMKAYDPDLEIRRIFSGMDNVSENKRWFNDEKEKDVCLLTVAMVNEGAHYDGVNTLVMFRRTHSTTLYLQQLGRVICLTDKPDPNAIVFDFTNNAQSLIHNAKLITHVSADVETSHEKKDAIERLQEAVRKNCEGKEKIYEDYTEDCVAVLSELMEANDRDGKLKGIISTFEEQLTDAQELKDIFDFDLYKNLKTDSKQKTKKKDEEKIKVQKHATNKAFRDEMGQNNCTTKEYLATDVQKLATALILSMKRSYSNYSISFTDDHKCDIIINNEDQFEKEIKRVGFKSADIVKNVVSNLGRKAFIYISQLA